MAQNYLVGVATQRLSPDRLEEKTRSHGVSGSAGGKSLLLCQPPQPNGFFHVHKQQPSIEVGPGSRFGREGLRCLQYRQRRRGSYYVLGPPSRYRLEGVTRSGRYTKLTAGITGWNRAARGEVSTGTRQG